MKYKVYVWGDEGEVVIHVEADNTTEAYEKANDKIDFFAEPDDDEDADQAPFLFGIIIPNPRAFVKRQAATCKRFHFNADRRPRFFPIPPLLYHTLNLL